MTLKNISNKKDKMKVEFMVKKDNKLLFCNWYKDWLSFTRTKTYRDYINNELQYCIVKYFNEMPYISCCVNY